MNKRLLVSVFVVLLALVPLGPAMAENPLDFSITDGHFYKQANGQGGAGDIGFAVTDEGGIPFWTSFQDYGGVANVGYPVSQRFIWKDFTVQAFQKIVFQWRPESNSVAFVNVFDELSAAGKDDWLLTVRSVPKSADWSSDEGKTWEQVVQNHYALLDQNPAIKQVYLSASDPVTMNGLPMAAQDYGDVFVVRAQRKVFQQWKQDTAWAKAGDVTVANGGDVGKEAELYAAQVILPTTWPPSTPTPTPVTEALPTATPPPVAEAMLPVGGNLQRVSDPIIPTQQSSIVAHPDPMWYIPLLHQLNCAENHGMLRLRATVLDQAGNPINGVPVIVNTMDGNWPVKLITGDKGPGAIEYAFLTSNHTGGSWKVEIEGGASDVAVNLRTDLNDDPAPGCNQGNTRNHYSYDVTFKKVR